MYTFGVAIVSMAIPDNGLQLDRTKNNAYVIYSVHYAHCSRNAHAFLLFLAPKIYTAVRSAISATAEFRVNC